MTRRRDPAEVIDELRRRCNDLEREKTAAIEAAESTTKVAVMHKQRVDALEDAIRWMTSEHPLGQLSVTVFFGTKDMERSRLIDEVIRAEDLERLIAEGVEEVTG